MVDFHWFFSSCMRNVGAFGLPPCFLKCHVGESGIGKDSKEIQKGFLVAALRGGHQSKQSAGLFSLSLFSTVAASDRKVQVLLALWPSVL